MRALAATISGLDRVSPPAGFADGVARAIRTQRMPRRGTWPERLRSLWSDHRRQWAPVVYAVCAGAALVVLGLQAAGRGSLFRAPVAGEAAGTMGAPRAAEGVTRVPLRVAGVRGVGRGPGPGRPLLRLRAPLRGAGVGGRPAVRPGARCCQAGLGEPGRLNRNGPLGPAGGRRALVRPDTHSRDGSHRGDRRRHRGGEPEGRRHRAARTGIGEENQAFGPTNPASGCSSGRGIGEVPILTSRAEDS